MERKFEAVFREKINTNFRNDKSIRNYVLVQFTLDFTALLAASKI